MGLINCAGTNWDKSSSIVMPFCYGVNILLGCLFALVANFSAAAVPIGGSKVYLFVGQCLFTKDNLFSEVLSLFNKLISLFVEDRMLSPIFYSFIIFV